MPRFNRKPIEVEAIQWFPGVEHPAIIKWANDFYIKWAKTVSGSFKPLKPGYWVIQSVEEPSYYIVMTPEEFAVSYEPADNGKPRIKVTTNPHLPEGSILIGQEGGTEESVKAIANTALEPADGGKENQ